MKKLLLLLVATLTITACNDDSDPETHYPSTNPFIEGGSLTGSNMHFFGSSTVTDAKGDTFTDKKAWFEFAGLNTFALYMHQTRFAANMPGVEMRLREISYTPAGDKAIRFSLAELIPEAERPNETGGGASYQPVPRFKITDLEGSVDGVNCQIRFTCAGVYHVEFKGKLIIKK